MLSYNTSCNDVHDRFPPRYCAPDNAYRGVSWLRAGGPLMTLVFIAPTKIIASLGCAWKHWENVGEGDSWYA